MPEVCKHLFISIILYFTLANLTQACELPLSPKIDKQSLKFHEYWDESNILKSAVVPTEFQLECETGLLYLNPESKITFASSGLIKTLTAGRTQTLMQQDKAFNLVAGSRLVFNSESKAVSIEPIGYSSIELKNITVEIRDYVEFYDDGQLKETVNKNPISMQLLGEQHTIGAGDKIRITSADYLLSNSESSLVGDWLLDSKYGNLSLRIVGHKTGEYQMLFLNGTPAAIDERIEVTGTINPIGNTFSLTEATEVKISFIGTIAVPNESSTNGGTKTVDIDIPAVLTFSGGKIKIVTAPGLTFEFSEEKDFKRFLTSIKIVMFTIFSFLIFSFIILIAFLITLNIIHKALTSEHDKRYKKQPRFKGGGSYNALFLTLMLSIVLALVIHTFLLEFLGIGSFFAFFDYWTR